MEATSEGILDPEAQVDKGANARLSSFVGAIAVADLVKTTLGPKGMDKILQSTSSTRNNVTVTNDGATILRSIVIDNPAAKILVNVSKIQDDEVGDGTTSVTVLAGELLREAEQLVNKKIHPQTIAQGWRHAVNIARACLETCAISRFDNLEAFRNDLVNIAKTTLSSKLLYHEKEHFATLAVDAVLRLGEDPDLQHIQIIKKRGGSLEQSFLEEGFILEKKIGVGQPKRIENARIMIANTPMDTDKIKIYGTRVRVDSITKLAEIEEAEKQKMREKCQKIIQHGINCFINRQLIYNLPESIFASNGVMAIEHADFDGVERLALVTGGEIVSTFDHPELVRLGHCDVIEEIMIGEDKMIRFSGCSGGAACTIVLRGASQHVLDEAERSLHDALCVLSQAVRDPRVVYGGGNTEIRMAQAIDAVVPQIAGKQALAMESFSRALRQIPSIISDNAGYDSAELISQLRKAHHDGDITAGLDMYSGSIGNMQELGITESYKSKLQQLCSAAEAAEMILRVDEIITSAPRRREEDHGH